MTPAPRLRRCCALVLLLVTAAAGTLAHAQAASPAPDLDTDARPHLAVLPVATAAGVPSGAGPTLAGLLVAGVDAERYALVERARTAQLLEETRFQDTELVDAATRAAEVGRLAGLRYLVLGEVSDLGPLRWTARVIDCETGAIGARGSVRFENYHAADAAAAELLAQLGLAVPGAATPPTSPVGHALMDACNPDPAVSLTLATGEGRTDYLDGESISFRVSADTDGYLTLVTLDAAGDLTLLLPNRWQPRATLRAGEPLALPAAGAGFRFPAQAPHGRTVVKAVFTTRPLMLRGVDPARIETEGFVAGGNLRDGEKAIGLAAALDTATDADDVATRSTAAETAPEATLRPATGLPGFAAHEWATAELVLDTRDPGAAGTESFATTPGKAGTFAMRPDPVPQPTPSPVADPTPEAAAGARRAVYDAWQRVLGSGDTKAIEASAPGPPVGDAWLIVRRARAETKSLTGPEVYVATVEHVPPADVKAIGEAALEAQLRQIRANDPGVVATLPNHGLISSYQVGAVGAAGRALQVTGLEIAPGPLSELQWPLANPFAPGLDTGWSRAAARIAGIDPALIAVVDRGLYTNDPRLRGALWTNPGEVPGNGVDDDGNGYIDDIHGWDPHTKTGVLHARTANPNAPATFNHGHFCASIIAGRPADSPDPNQAVRGFAPRAKILTAVGAANDPARADDGLRGLITALRYAANNGAKVINLSLGNDPAQFRFTPALAAEYRRLPVWDELERASVLLVCAAGNAHHDLDREPVMPAALGRPNVISVMAIDPSGQPGHRFDPASATWKPYSNYGSTTVHLAAPGSYVLGAPAPGRVGTANESCGTSFATPLVSSAAALVWGQHPDWDAVTVRRALLETTRPLAALRGRCVTGGTLDVDAALRWTP